ncbi:hypothetical protein X777_01978 [Ooceraea biroi]|uniref:Uncharacterized protein n=1 Tax=Ooceraea biroi TaxID=2015173 RepID=A0A026WPQ3_OOCBI|nr:hypothetical protein X777_01978 [Ooceraea biroi]
MMHCTQFITILLPELSRDGDNRVESPLKNRAYRESSAHKNQIKCITREEVL